MSKASGYNLFIALMLISSCLISSPKGKISTLILAGLELRPWLSPANNWDVDLRENSVCFNKRVTLWPMTLRHGYLRTFLSAYSLLFMRHLQEIDIFSSSEPFIFHHFFSKTFLGFCSVGCFNQFLCLWRMHSFPNFTVCRKALATYPNQLLWAPAPAASYFNMLTIQFWVQKHAQEQQNL